MMFFADLRRELMNIVRVVNELEAKSERGIPDEAEAEAVKKELRKKTEEAVTLLDAVKKEAKAIRAKTRHDLEHTRHLLSLMDDLHEHMMALRVHSKTKYDTTVFDQYIAALAQLPSDESEKTHDSAEGQPSASGYGAACASPDCNKEPYMLDLGRTPPPPVIKHTAIFKTFRGAVDTSETTESTEESSSDE